MAIPLTVDLAINRQRYQQRYRHACIDRLKGKTQSETRDREDHSHEYSQGRGNHNHGWSDQGFSILDQQTALSPANDMGHNLQEKAGSTFERSF